MIKAAFIGAGNRAIAHMAALTHISDVEIVAIAELDETVKTSTEDRTKDHATNTQTVEDAKEAQIGVGQAIAILKEFYANAAESTALVLRIITLF